MTRDQFYTKHRASAQEIMQGTFAVTCALADLRECADRYASKTGSEDMRQTAADLDRASAACVRMITRIPTEILTALYDEQAAAGLRQEAPATKEIAS